MGMRKYKRQIARAHMIEDGVGNVNGKMSMESGGVKLWRLALADSTATHRAKARKPRRVVRQVEKVGA